MSAASPALAVRGLSRRFGNLRPIQDLSLTVHPGDVYGLLGLNGAGKTTTLRIVLGLIPAHEGTIEIYGREAPFGDVESRRRVGAFVEGPSLIPELTARENIRLLTSLGHRRVVMGADEADQLLATVGLSAARERRVRGFSLGMRQRLGIALALAPEPRLVILDEPTNGLDPRGMHEIRELIQSLHRDRGLTFVVSSHLLHEVESLCTRVGIVHAGRVLEEGPLQALLKVEDQEVWIEGDPGPLTEKVLLQATGHCHPSSEGFLVNLRTEQIPEVVAALVNAGVRIRRISPRPPSLEGLFLAKTEASP